MATSHLFTTVAAARTTTELPEGRTENSPGLGGLTGVWTFFAAERTDIEPWVEAWIAAQRLNRLAQVL